MHGRSHTRARPVAAAPMARLRGQALRVLVVAVLATHAAALFGFSSNCVFFPEDGRICGNLAYIDYAVPPYEYFVETWVLPGTPVVMPELGIWSGRACQTAAEDPQPVSCKYCRPSESLLHHAATGHDICAQCPYNKANPYWAQLTYSLDTGCYAWCPAGQMHRGTTIMPEAGDAKPATECVPCPAGFSCPSSAVLRSNGDNPISTEHYKPKPCEPGYAVNSTGAVACTACAPGTYTPLYMSHYCEPCPSGTYVEVAGAKACTPCAANTYSTGGAAVCTPCAVNSISAAGAAAHCAHVTRSTSP